MTQAWREKLEEHLRTLEQQRQQFMSQANLQLGQYDGRIAMLRELLAGLDGEPNEGVNAEDAQASDA